MVDFEFRLRARLASYPGLPSQLFSQAVEKAKRRPGCCEGRPGYEAAVRKSLGTRLL